ncbi:MAG: hypothetical protein KC486_19635 [Myxococcales bacterium]|nr:hypothetical protein [Myxococcales bacterium]
MGKTFEEAGRALEPLIVRRDAGAAVEIAAVLRDCGADVRGAVVEHLEAAWGECPPLLIDDREGELAVFVEEHADELEGVVEVGGALLVVRLGEGKDSLLARDPADVALPGGFRRAADDPPARVLAGYFRQLADIFVRERASLHAYVSESVWSDLACDWRDVLSMIPLPDADAPRVWRALEPASFSALEVAGVAEPWSCRAVLAIVVPVLTGRGGFVTVRCAVEARAHAGGIAWAHEIYDLEGLDDLDFDDW